MRLFIFILLIFCIFLTVRAQEQKDADTSDVGEEMQLEKLLETTTQDEENSTTAEEIALLKDNPLDLNTASAEELQHIPGITNLVAVRLIERRAFAPFTSKEELLSVDGITPELFSFIRQFVRVGKLKERSNVSGSYLSRAMTEVEKRKGFLNGAYPGSQFKMLNRLNLSLGSNESPLSSIISTIEVGALTEKDPGEKSLTDFLSGYARVSIPALSTRLLAGDYKIEAAEGLVFWSASAFSKGSDVISPVRKNGGGINPYRSSDENSFFRGFATSIEFEKAQIQMFYSNKALNATINSFDQISSIDRSGLFRTESELRRQNSTSENIVGGRVILYPYKGIKIGGTGYVTRLANPLLLKGSNDAIANKLWMHGIDIAYTSQKVEVFSEIAVDWANALAMISGITYEPLPTLAMTLVARKYPSAFQSIHGNAFGESSGQVQNENGVYVGIRFQPINRLWVSTYYDQFEHPQPTASIPVPSHGNDFLALAEFKMTKKFEIAFRFKRKDLPSVTDENDFYGRIIRRVIPRVQENYRLTSEFISSPSIRLSNRIELAKINYVWMKKAEQGLLLYQSIKWTFSKSLTLQTRLAVFETDSYDSRIYEFEEDLPGAYSNTALFGRGLRWYLIIRYQLFSRVNIIAKYAQTVKEDVKSMGTGLDEIKGNSQSTISMQIDVRF